MQLPGGSSPLLPPCSSLVAFLLLRWQVSLFCTELCNLPGAISHVKDDLEKLFQPVY